MDCELRFSQWPPNFQHRAHDILPTNKYFLISGYLPTISVAKPFRKVEVLGIILWHLSHSAKGLAYNKPQTTLTFWCLRTIFFYVYIHFKSYGPDKANFAQILHSTSSSPLYSKFAEIFIYCFFIAKNVVIGSYFSQPKRILLPDLYDISWSTL